MCFSFGNRLVSAKGSMNYFKFVAYNQLESQVANEDETSTIRCPILSGKSKSIQFIYLHKRRFPNICALPEYIGSLQTISELKKKATQTKMCRKMLLGLQLQGSICGHRKTTDALFLNRMPNRCKV